MGSAEKAVGWARPEAGLYFLFGPTAVGKTSLAIEWAVRHGAEILSCDALCVYAGMDLGTAKPDALQRAQVQHHGLDWCPVDRLFSVAAYRDRVAVIVEQVVLHKLRPLLVVGGSGLYLKSFFAPVADRWESDDSTRREVEELETAAGLAGLLRELDLLNPNGTGSLDRQNPRRVANALCRCRASGLTVEELGAAFRREPPPFPNLAKHILGLERADEDLSRRVAIRTEAMLAEGLVEEVRRLRAAGLEKNPSASRAIGYREVLAWLDQREGERSARGVLAAEISLHTRQLIRKQRSWFRHQMPPHPTLDLTNFNPLTAGARWPFARIE